jgi:hypothetical protein
MKPRNQAILILSGGFLFLILGIWWLTLPDLQRGAYAWLIGGVIFVIGGLVKLQRSPHDNPCPKLVEGSPIEIRCVRSTR